MYSKKNYCEVFNKSCTVNEIYSNEDLRSIIENANLTDYNITAFTYNRWNKGMTDINPLFEYIGRSQYKFLGYVVEYPYTGKVFHYEKGTKNTYHIANWVNGELIYLNDINDFNEWRNSDYDGERTINENSFFTVNYRGKIEKWCFQENKKGYLKKNFDSKLGQELYGKKVGESFSILGNQGTIVSIDI